MTSIEVKLELPLTRWLKLPGFTPVTCGHISLTENKTLEAEVYCDTDVLVAASFTVTNRQDHAGVHCTLALLGVVFHLSVCDNRHWDWINDCWENGEHNEF